MDFSILSLLTLTTGMSQPLFSAAASGREDDVQRLLEAKADVEAKVMEIDRKLKLVADGAEKAVSELKASTDWGS